MNEIKELHVIKNGNKVEVEVKSDIVTALALLSVLITAMEREMGISAEKILEVVGAAIENGKGESVKTPENRALELEALGTPIVKWLQKNSCPSGAVIVDSYGIRLVQDEIGIPTREAKKYANGSR